MDNQFWLNKWDKQQTGFNLNAPHAALQKLYEQIFNARMGVFLPLCGKSADLKYIADKGSYTLGNELSVIAVKALFAENSLSFSTVSTDKFEIYENSNIQILQGDFFELTASHVARCQGIYDRAALIALPKQMRVDYVAHLKRLFRRAKMLLITLEYCQQEMPGPPFSVDYGEVEQLFSFASVTRLLSDDRLREEPKFAERGLTSLAESAYLIEWSI